jgi:transcriptional regulator with PAS, ATPase and Fis domain
MQEAVAIASRLAPRSVPVLVLGESGTGKELFARAIHRTSPRRDRGFLAVNCGAIPTELADARLFGHARGAFTGAVEDRPGVFEEASGGTLFLDEIGELPLEAQVRLLRVLQEGEVVRVGEHEPRPVDVRVIAATHVDLFDAVREERFRLDLLYRLAVGIVHLPPLRERGGDLKDLLDLLLEEVQAELDDQPDFRPRPLSHAARLRIQRHDWPGNVRELRTTLVRAALFAEGDTIGEYDIERALLPPARSTPRTLLDRPLDEAFDLKALELELRDHYVRRALAEAGGVKAKAARLLRVSPQTFQHWAP